MKQMIVIGGGAAGMMAAVTAAREGARVTILEHTDKCGKKILSTGNGRCNLTNELMPAEKGEVAAFFRTEDPDFVWTALSEFGFQETCSFFESMGICLTEKNGYYYPRSLQAQTVRNSLLSELLRLGVEIVHETSVKEIKKDTAGLFQVRTESGDCYAAARVVLACGGMAAPLTGSDGSGYALAKQFGHHVRKPLPALTALRSEKDPLWKASGVRCQGRIVLEIPDAKEEALSDSGELQLTDYGISGIPVFQVSRAGVRALDEGKTPVLQMNFLPEYEPAEGRKLIERLLLSEGKDVAEVLNGLFPEKLSLVFLKKAGIPAKFPTAAIRAQQKEKLIASILDYSLKITGSNTFSQAQVTSGGIPVSEIDPKTMESKLEKNLYFAGEMIDVDAICGGYNLQWAWTSGYLAGKQERS